MNKIPSEQHSVDRVGYRQVTRAVRCVLRARRTNVEETTQANRQWLPERPAERRSRMIIRSAE